MAPVLLDQRRLLQLFAGLALALAIAFAAGYQTALRKAEQTSAQISDRVALALPEPVTTASIEPVVPEVIAPGAEIDVDAPDTQVAPAEPETENPGSEPAKPAAKKIQTPAKVEVATKAAPAPEIANAPVPPAEAALSIGGPAPDLQGDEALASLAIVDNASADDALYSIQVGIYGSVNNAQRQVDTLSAHNLSAYLDEYQNKDNQTRYNVRFGYFASRASAVAALEAWQAIDQPQSSHGYVVRLSR